MQRIFISILIGWISVAISGCSNRSEQSEKGANHPRIVSFAPSLTQILFDMGLSRNIVGVTRWCVLPKGVSKPIVGDRFHVNTEAILNVDPDIILIQQNP